MWPQWHVHSAWFISQVLVMPYSGQDPPTINMQTTKAQKPPAEPLRFSVRCNTRLLKYMASVCSLLSDCSLCCRVSLHFISVIPDKYCSWRWNTEMQLKTYKTHLACFTLLLYIHWSRVQHCYCTYTDHGYYIVTVHTLITGTTLLLYMHWSRVIRCFVNCI